MPDIKENIKQELTKLVEQEKNALYYRRIIADKLEEHYQITAEESFIKRLERFIKSI
jgi:flagellar biosynthesis/type III secretory pathway chaperone